MLGKLIRYDLKALGRTLLPVQLGALLVGIIATLVLTATLRYIENSSSFQVLTETEMLGSSLASFSFLAVFLLSVVLFSSFLVTLLLTARYFYTNLMGDEGYLSFTLPVTVHQHLLSKTISGFIWNIINALVISLSLALLLIFGTAYSGLVNTEVLQALSEGFRWLFSNGWGIVLVEFPIEALVGVVSSLLLIYASIVAGSIIASRHKVAAAVGIFFAANLMLYSLNSMAQGVVVTLTGFNLERLASMVEPHYMELMAFYQMTMLVTLAISIVTIIAAYSFSHYALSNRLNLE